MTKHLRMTLAAFFLAMLTACSTAQVQTGTTDVATVASDVQTACTAVNATAAAVQASPLAMVPQVASVLPYVTGSCGTAAAVAAMVSKAVTDPTTVAWINGLNADLVAVEAQVKTL